MILRRIGAKHKIADKIIKHFPSHDYYIELFFGAGGLFFNKKKAKYNICNDIDNDIFNLFMVIRHKKQQLYNIMYETVLSDSIFEYWKKNKEKNDVWRAARFLYLSNYSYLGDCSTLRMQLNDNSKKILLENIEKTYKLIQDVKFTNVDFRNVLKKIIKSKNKNKTFVYADPPYLDKKNNYSDSFTIKDTEDLFNILIGSGYKFAISEFPSPPILELVSKYKLNKIEITERRTLNNRSLEILITNYNNNDSLF